MQASHQAYPRMARGARRVAAIGLFGALFSAPVKAQMTLLVPEGADVRVWAPTFGLRKARGSVLDWRQSALLFDRQSEGVADTVAFGGIKRLDIYLGKRSAGYGALRGAAWGMVVGWVLGALAGEAATSGCQEFLCGLDVLGYWAGGMVVGAAVGAGVGASQPPEHWERVDLPVSAGFPPYREPFYKSTAFRVGSMVVSLGLTFALTR